MPDTPPGRNLRTGEPPPAPAPAPTPTGPADPFRPHTEPFTTCWCGGNATRDGHIRTPSR